MKTIYLLSKNKGKILVAKDVFSKYKIKVKILNKEYPEIQADSSLEIAKFTALQAAKEFNAPVIREDHSLFINALGGFPGPYTNYFDKKIPGEKILELLKNQIDRSGFLEVATVYAEPNGFTKEFVFRVSIKISKEIKGTKGNWDRVLMLKNSNKTFAEQTEEENVNVWNKNFVEIAKYLSDKN